MSPPSSRLLAVLALPALAAACAEAPCPPGSTRKADGLCYLPDGADTAVVPDQDSGDDGLALEAGDPILVVGYEGENVPGGFLLEWTDAAILSPSLGAVCGVAGVGLVDLTDGSTISTRPTPPCLRLAAANDVVVASDRTSQLTLLDVADPANILELGFVRFDTADGRHEDIAIHDRRILVGWHDNGARIFDPGGNWLGTLPAQDAFAVGLHENRAVVSDGEALVLWDISNTREPIELSRVPLPGEGRDIEFDGSRVAVAMGGAGVGVWDVEGDALVERATAIVPGAGLSVALDGDEIWVGSWQHTILLRLSGGELLTMGHEAPRFSAMGVAARDGLALVADWHGHMTLQRQRDVSSAELILNGDLFFGPGDATQHVRVENHGQLPLSWSVGELPAGFSVSAPSVVVEPGGVEVIRVEGPAALDHRDTLPWTSDDPDERSGEIALAPPDRGVGAVHPDFSLQGFTWPDRDTTTHTLSAQRGKVVVLAYFALF